MTVTIDGTTGIDKVQDGSIVYADLNSNIPLGTKNLIINGNMQIAQRGTSSTGQTTSGYKTCDRFYVNINSAGTWTITQDTDVPSGYGFANSLKLSCTTADASLSAGDQVGIDTRIESQNLQHLKYGTSSAEKLTLSFWVKSNKTGTQTFELAHFGSSTRHIAKTYTIDTADTWEKKTITIDGDTSMSPDNDNALGFVIKWWLGAGSNFTSGTLATSWANRDIANAVSSSNVNLADSTSNYINITAVQLEQSENATPFEQRMYSQELAMCQRYYFKVGPSSAGDRVAIGYAALSTLSDVLFVFPVTMRDAPTALEQTGTASDYGVQRAAGQLTCSAVPVFTTATKNQAAIRQTVSSGLTTGEGTAARLQTTSAYYAWSAEL